MKDLLNISGPSIVAALNERAYAVLKADDETIEPVELLPPTSGSVNGQGQKKNPIFNTVEAVACKFLPDEGLLLCAVSRYDKTVSVYSLALNTDAGCEKIVEVAPVVVHKTNKRSCAIEFADIPYDDKSKGSLNILVTGDLAGDVQAFPIEASSTKKVRRLLLGHTASTLLAIKIVNGRIFTADRDEKVRVSSFPVTYNVEGYLLGNTQYVTDMDVFGKDSEYCVTVSGDCSLRLWDTKDFVELAHLNVAPDDDDDDEGNDVDKDKASGVNGSDDEKNVAKDIIQIPVRVAASASGDRFSVVYNEKDSIDIFSVKEVESGEAIVEKVQSIECHNPLAVAFNSQDDIFVLTKEPDLMVHFVKNSEGSYIKSADCKVSSAMSRVGAKNEVKMPQSIIETDKVTGKFRLMKNVHDERETYVEHKPWLRGKDRIKKMKEKDRRRKRRKRESEQSLAIE